MIPRALQRELVAKYFAAVNSYKSIIAYRRELFTWSHDSLVLKAFGSLQVTLILQHIIIPQICARETTTIIREASTVYVQKYDTAITEARISSRDGAMEILMRLTFSPTGADHRIGHGSYSLDSSAFSRSLPALIFNYCQMTLRVHMGI